MKLLHTADLHLARHLYGRRRHHEFAAFLDWLAATLEAEQVDVLVIAGDVFDTATPSPRSQAQYYQFLCRIAAGPCRHVIITAGNHDSPAFLDAPRDILRALNVHVIGTAREPADEVLLLRDRDGAPEAIVCAVPYLRERDLRSADAGESPAEKAAKLLDGIRAHYAAAVAHAETLRSAHGAALPLLATGHLYTAGSQTSEAHDHEIGTLTHVPASVFPAAIDYLALGHIHLAQRLDGSETRRYSGSPLAHTFAEAAQNKTVCLVTFQGRSAAVRPLAVPDFQKRARLRGDLPALEAQISELAATGDNIWLEIHYEGEAVEGGLRDRLHRDGVLRFNEIRRILPAVSQRTLTAQLRALEADGIIERTVYPEVPPRVEYRLSAYGQTLAPVLLALKAWGDGHKERARQPEFVQTAF